MEIFHILGMEAPKRVMTRVQRCGCMARPSIDSWRCPYSEKIWRLKPKVVHQKLKLEVELARARARARACRTNHT